MNEVIELKVLENYLVWIKFSDEEEKVLDLENFIGKGFTKELLQSEKFSEAFIEPGGGIAWPNGFDLCPNFLRKLQDVGHMA